MCKIEGSWSKTRPETSCGRSFSLPSHGVSARPSTDSGEIRSNLLKQLTAPVLWTQTVRNMLEDGAERFFEIGPGKVLQGLVGKTAGPDISIGGLE